MAMSKLQLPVVPWLQGRRSPQIDYIDALTDHDPDFTDVTCRYYTVQSVYNLRGLPVGWVRDWILGLATALPGIGDYKDITPFALHFGWLHQKQAFDDFVARTWPNLVTESSEPRPVSAPVAESASPVPVE
jgi:hypothetical protein